jgi:hypothetical protein
VLTPCDYSQAVAQSGVSDCLVVLDGLTKGATPDTYNLKIMPRMIFKLLSKDKFADAALYFREAMDNENEEHRAAVRAAMQTNAAVVPLVRVLKQTALARKVQYDIACALTNFSSGGLEYAQSLYDAGGLQVLVDLLRQPASPKGQPDIRELLPWNLTNLATDHVERRDEMLRLDVLTLVSLTITAGERPCDDVCREVAALFFALHNIKPRLPWCESKKCLPAIIILLEDTRDVDTAQRCLWTLADMAFEPPTEAWDLLLAQSVLRVIDRMLQVHDDRVTVPAALVCGRLACGNPGHVDKLLEPQYHMLAHLRVMMSGTEHERRQSFWAVSNFLAEAPSKHVQNFVDENIIPITIEASNSPVEEIRDEAICCLANATRHGTDTHVRSINLPETIVYMCRMFEVVPESADVVLPKEQEATVADALDVLIALLRVSELDRGQQTSSRNACARKMVELGAPARLANLALRPTALGDRAARILAFYFRKT